MLSHQQIWAAIDALAQRQGQSPSALARLAGLDPTTFNKSKRVAASGKLRWPSTESIAKVLQAAGIPLDEFLALAARAGGEKRAGLRLVPLLGFAQAGAQGFFDDAGFPAGSGWEEIPFPDLTDENAYALEISGESMLPVYRDGDVIVVSPAAQVRKGDRVVAKTVEGEVMAKVLARQTAKRVEFRSLNPAYGERVLDLSQIAWMSRIIWASQ